MRAQTLLRVATRQNSLVLVEVGRPSRLPSCSFVLEARQVTGEPTRLSVRMQWLNKALGKKREPTYGLPVPHPPESSQLSSSIEMKDSMSFSDYRAELGCVSP